MCGIFGIVYRGGSAGAEMPDEVRLRKTGELLEHRGPDALGFWTTAFERMQTSERYFDDSFVSELFGLSRAQVGRADSDLVMRLLHLDVWAQVCLRGESLDAPIAKLHDHVHIESEAA